MRSSRNAINAISYRLRNASELPSICPSRLCLRELIFIAIRNNNIPDARIYAEALAIAISFRLFSRQLAAARF